MFFQLFFQMFFQKFFQKFFLVSEPLRGLGRRICIRLYSGASPRASATHWAIAHTFRDSGTLAAGHTLSYYYFLCHSIHFQNINTAVMDVDRLHTVDALRHYQASHKVEDLQGAVAGDDEVGAVLEGEAAGIVLTARVS